MTMPAGTYYVGDLCYVLQGSDWDDVIDLMFPDSRSGHYGEHTLMDGRKFAILRTAYGDGEYPDDRGNSYPVDSGTIGCILTDATSTTHGAIIQFDQPFEVVDRNGTLCFGDVEIYTDI